jgi:predicted metal-dependent HD superfamily phosphohydrolase
MLKEIFTNLAKGYSDDLEQVDRLWEELDSFYSKENRYYHCLSHLENVFLELKEIREFISDWDTILFSLFYHDVIYQAEQSDNEEQSADLAEKRMHQLRVPSVQIQKCREQILATKKHGFHSDPDTNYFTDADLSVLGQDWETYLAYAKNVRKEYAVFPDALYNPGRAKVLKHFLEMERIFKTPYFYNRLEKPAKENMQREMVEVLN